MIVPKTPFEGVAKEDIVDFSGIRYVEFRKTLTPKYSQVWLHVAIYYAAIIVIVLCVCYGQKKYPVGFWLTIPVGSTIIGYAFAALNLFMHEASHYNLFPKKNSNDWLANIVLGVMIGMETEYYRSIHFSHHKLIGTKNDTECSYFEAPTIRFLVESFVGIRVLKVLVNRRKSIYTNYGIDIGKKIIKKNYSVFALAVILHMAILSAFLFEGYWHMALAWILGVGFVFPFLAMLRQILEHRTDTAESLIDYKQVDQGASHRMFGDGFSASVFGAVGFNRHLLHHWDPQISYTRLKDVESYLINTTLNEELERNRTTYFKTLIRLIRK
jgi:fatty acid desaturase